MAAEYGGREEEVAGGRHAKVAEYEGREEEVAGGRHAKAAGYGGREEEARRRTRPLTSPPGRGDIKRNDGYDASDASEPDTNLKEVRV